MSKKIYVLVLLLGFSAAFAASPIAVPMTPNNEWNQLAQGGQTGWVQGSSAETGWYWAYDAYSHAPFNSPYIGDPMQVFPRLDNSTAQGINKLEPYNDRPYQYELIDSFWYFNHWYKPGDHIYISPDGWLSFDENSSDGANHPPASVPPMPNTIEPNEIIAVLWQDMDPTLDQGDVDENRVYYTFRGHGPPFTAEESLRAPTLTVQWNKLKSVAQPTHTYDFACVLDFGGQARLEDAGNCGIVFSYMFIEMSYDNEGAPFGWDQEAGVIGIEDQSGDYGLTYEGTIGTGVSPNPQMESGFPIRWGYKKLYRHDVAGILILSPGKLVLRHTPIEPQLIVGNVGLEVEHFNAVYEVWEEDGSEPVYQNVLGSYDLFPGVWDTLIAPCWTPGEFGTVYTNWLWVDLDGDLCTYNDTFEMISIVGCDDTFRYDWNFAYVDEAWGNASQEYYLGMFYPVDNGVLITGARVFIDAFPDPLYFYDPPVYPALAVYEANNGCGGIVDPPSKSPVPGCKATTETYQIGWNNAHFGYRNPKTGQNTGVFVHSAPGGNVWLGMTASTAGFTGSMRSVALRQQLDPHPCYNNSWNTQTRSASWSATGQSWWMTGSSFLYEHDQCPDPSVVSYYTDIFNYPLELFVHLGFGPYPMSPKPQHPCYHDEPHDIMAYRFEKPFLDWIEDGEPLTCEVGITNLGRQTEPDQGFFPVKLYIVEVETGDTFWSETTLINKLGWGNDDTDDPDTILVPFTPFAPEGACVDWQIVYGEPGGSPPPFEDVGVDYEFIGLVRLGEVGPDLSDHCPYNDTTRIWVTCLLSHDVGVVDLQNEEGHAWGNSWTDPYAVGTEFTCVATVENFGFQEEHDFVVDLEIYDADKTPDSLVWHATEPVSFLDWRGNTLDNPYLIDVTYPTWSTPSTDWFRIECRTELVGDLCPVNDELTRHINIAVAEVPPGLPFALEAIKPNPFMGSARISFALPHSTSVSLKVYDISGKLVATLVNGAEKPGRHTVTWNGTDDAGRSVAQGIYLVRMDAENFSATKKVVLY
ncbi:T9SS type A sorting domain-containing protein [candidate division WOR-3 bacterium]|nr:T9SS type A sorting domain-containing protein [candidate division WOR-3 bacterium]